MATYSSILAWTIPRTEEPEGHGPWYTTKHTDTQTHRHRKQIYGYQRERIREK